MQQVRVQTYCKPSRFANSPEFLDLAECTSFVATGAQDFVVMMIGNRLKVTSSAGAASQACDRMAYLKIEALRNSSRVSVFT